MKGKIINDPIYGFLRFDHKDLIQLIDHPLFQRLRRIKQMGMAHYVYPGATHTRFHHSLGACHLMHEAIHVLQRKGIYINATDALAAQQAILLHDIGHGPFSHALEHSIVKGVHHESLSLALMERIHQEGNVDLSIAMNIFKKQHDVPFLAQLVSGQLDMDRMDYLNRDSFYSGVSEGVIGYDRILQMLDVKQQKLVVEEKAIQSVEKFLIARRLMYWQVYLHKTVIAAEKLLINILKRAKQLALEGANLFATPTYKEFLYNQYTLADFSNNPQLLDAFCSLDDSDIAVSIKSWMYHDDPILSRLCAMLVHRHLYKIKLSDADLSDTYQAMMDNNQLKEQYSAEELSYYVNFGTSTSDTYTSKDGIQVYYKSGELKDMTEIEHTLITKEISKPISKTYIITIPELAPNLYN